MPPAKKKEAPISMRFRDDDIAIIDRGAAIAGLSRSEFMRQAALQEAQMAILNETLIRVSPEAFEEFLEILDRRPTPPSPKVIERLKRTALVDR